MTVKKVDNHRAVKWFVIDGQGKAIAGFTTKKSAEHAKANYENWGWK